MMSTAFQICNLCLIASLAIPAGTSGGRLAAQTAKVETVATFPSNRFIENLCKGPDNAIYVTALFEHTIFRIALDGKVSTFATPPVANILGITTMADGFLVTAYARSIPIGQGQAIDMTDLGSSILMIDKSGKVTARIEGEKGAAFNGIAPLGDRAYLIADTEGSVWRFDVTTKAISRWLKDPRFSPTREVPYGSNGIKVQNGWVYVSVTSRNAVYRVRLGTDGRPGGALETFAEGLPVDDFDLGPDGSLYTSFVSQARMFKVMPTGKVTVLLEDIPGGAATLVSKNGRWLYWTTPQRNSTPARLLRTSIR